MTQHPTIRESVAVSIAALLLYVASSTPYVQLGDDGLFVLAASAAGPAHPPGYPLFVAAGWLATRIAPGHPVLAVHLVSSLFGALAIGLVPPVGRRLGLSRTGRVSAALALAASPVLWSQSLVAEVYSLHLLLMLGLLLALLRLAEAPDRPRALWVGLALGLALAHHWPLTLLSVPALVWLLPARSLAMVFAAAAPSMLLPYLWLWRRSVADPSVSFLGPLPTASDLLRFVGRTWYAEGAVERGGTTADRVALLLHAASEAAWQLTPAGFLLAGLGAAVTWRRDRRVWWVLGGLFLLNTAVPAVRLLDRAGPLQELAYTPWPVVGYAALALLAGLGLDRLPRPRVWAGLGVVVLIALGWPRYDRAWATTYARAVLAAPAPDALLVTAGDTDTGPIGVVHRVLGVRPDLRLATADGTVLAPRLLTPGSGELGVGLRAANRPVFATTPLPVAVTEAVMGPVRRLDPGQPGTRRPADDADMRRYLDAILTARPSDPWIDAHRRRLLFGIGELAALHHAVDPWTPRDDAWRARLDAAGLYGILGALGTIEATQPPERVLEWTDAALSQVDARTERLARAQLRYTRGRALYRLGRVEEAVASLEASWRDHHTRPDDGVGVALLQVYAEAGRVDDYWRVRRAGWAAGTEPAAVRALDERVGQ